MSPFSLEPQPDEPKSLIESLEARLLCARGTSTLFIRGVITIAPPGDVPELHINVAIPAQAVNALKTVAAKSHGVIIWEPT